MKKKRQDATAQFQTKKIMIWNDRIDVNDLISYNDISLRKKTHKYDIRNVFKYLFLRLSVFLRRCIVF